MPRLPLLPTLFPLVLIACNAHDLAAPHPKPELQNNNEYATQVRDLDILFMIDNSGSMLQEQANLAKNFPVFMNELKGIKGGLPDVHVAVVNSDLGAGSKLLGSGACSRVGGDRGIFHTKPDCGLDGNSRFISSFKAGTLNNFGQRDIADVFTCMAGVGIRGCGFEHQLQSTRVALYESITPENAGFLRENAFLALILITDEDDCSAGTDSDLFTDRSFPGTEASFRCAQRGHLCDGKSPPVGPFQAPLSNCTANDGGPLIKVSEIVNSIRALKKNPDEQILVSGIFGWPTGAGGGNYEYGRFPEMDNPQPGIDLGPICNSMNGKAMPGLRMKQFVESFGSSSSMFSICNDDFSPAMKKIGERLAEVIGRACITAPLVDTRAQEPGVQPDCRVSDFIPVGGGIKEESLPPCTGGTRSPGGACWELTADEACAGSKFKVTVDRKGRELPLGARQAIKCLTCASPSDPRCKRE